VQAGDKSKAFGIAPRVGGIPAPEFARKARSAGVPGAFDNDLKHIVAHRGALFAPCFEVRTPSDGHQRYVGTLARGESL
jgi:hypothetical protein